MIISILTILGVIVIYKLIRYYIDKYFYYEFVWLIHRTIFRSYKVLRFFFILFILSYIILGFYYLFSSGYVTGILVLILAAYLFNSVIRDIKNGKINFQKNFDFHKYNTSVQFYQNQSEKYRIKSFQSILDKIKATQLTTESFEKYQNNLIEEFFPHIDKILTFEYYDAKLSQSLSKQNTGTLFYSNFIKNVGETFNRIKIRSNEFQELSRGFPNISDFLLNLELVDFNDQQGYHFNSSLLDEKLDEYIIENNPLRKNAGILKFNGDEKKIHRLFKKYLELKYKDDDRFTNLKEQFAIFVNFFCTDNYYESPSIKDFEKEDIKYLIGFFSYLKGKEIATYQVSKLVYLVLRVTGFISEINNSSYEQAHRNPKYLPSKNDVKELNSCYD